MKFEEAIWVDYAFQGKWKEEDYERFCSQHPADMKVMQLLSNEELYNSAIARRTKLLEESHPDPWFGDSLFLRYRYEMLGRLVRGKVDFSQEVEPKKKEPKDTREVEILSNEIKVRNNAIKRLKRQVQTKSGKILEENELRTLADSNRKKNGTLNFSAMGRATGKSNHTIKRWCGDCGIE